ncbi:acetyl-CoA acetyltransferase [Paenibacillus apiarius]|uniref:Acetyl-CoA acetyltransferase n=1 Tax=Paenibacillus apiarius TaxID=46240 RepID=A0ABT4DZQ5_9BACL|nr:acetyl-CoA acetyltransferase [Paenibacillus apiarius]MCY9513079.1 acetyl-CoA acetyltransferase [Paenibacillus apiarius]MCY9521563.1 acetyl-CoA acetyltransferase [Paenibacillus apiarius]MCY9551717.1 acetyl-CoA acetyltransferase [Paenibacillus apiarius]MCY9560495.1 acetyl-CoA acetyltransferase [Paenibacillus apiarius]MCY9685255.1 acetyl-CoA acetyltransferase [Paenibacillus apiarius]
MHNPVQQQLVYQADPATVQAMQSAREKVHHVGNMYKHRYVRVQTMDGQVYDGVIVNVDRDHIYLQTQHPMQQRSLYGSFYYNDVILPLVLYNLLVISLL